MSITTYYRHPRSSDNGRYGNLGVFVGAPKRPPAHRLCLMSSGTCWRVCVAGGFPRRGGNPGGPGTTRSDPLWRLCGAVEPWRACPGLVLSGPLCPSVTRGPSCWRPVGVLLAFCDWGIPSWLQCSGVTRCERSHPLSGSDDVRTIPPACLPPAPLPARPVGVLQRGGAYRSWNSLSSRGRLPACAAPRRHSAAPIVRAWMSRVCTVHSGQPCQSVHPPGKRSHKRASIATVLSPLAQGGPFFTSVEGGCRRRPETCRARPWCAIGADGTLMSASCLATNGAVVAVCLPAPGPRRTPGTPWCDRLPMAHRRARYGSWTHNLFQTHPHACGTPDAPRVAAVDHHPSRAAPTCSDYSPPG